MKRWNPTEKKSTKDMKTFKRMKKGGDTLSNLGLG